MRQLLRRVVPEAYWPVAEAIAIANGVSLLLFLVRVVGADSFRYGFMFWNLWLAIIPLLLALWLLQELKRRPWLSWQNGLLTIAWLGFLPNSFYIATDLIHLHLTGEINILFDAVWFLSCIFNGFTFGFISLFLVHRELIRRFGQQRSHAAVAAILFMCSFAIYLGRYLRWNTWDVLTHPFALLFDVSVRIINPIAHPQVVTTTVTFFLLLGSMYLVIYNFVHALRGSKR